MLSTNPFLENFPGLSVFPNQEDPETNGYKNFEGSSSSSSPSTSCETCSSGGEGYEPNKYANPFLRYISDILMDEEDDLEKQPCMLQECLRLQAAEKSFYDVLGHAYPNPDSPSQVCGFSPEGNGDYGRTTSFESNSSSCTTDYSSYDSDWVNLVGEYESHNFPQLDPLMDPQAANVAHYISKPRLNEEVPAPAATAAITVSREKRRNQMDDTSYEQDGRGSKISAVFSDHLEEPPELLDEVLSYQLGRNQLCCGNSDTRPNAAESGGSSGKAAAAARSKKGANNTGAAVDLWTLLTQCAQAVANYDQRNANELLKQIRQHSMPTGDGLQRMAHYFATGLEARLAAGTPSYSQTPLETATAAEMLKAYKLFVTASPLQRMSNSLSTKTILKLVENRSSVHIIDFGICYGFQWPCIVRRLSERHEGVRLRITGIDLPQPGFRPAERLEETGRRLENFCKKFKVPFEYNCIADKWENIRLEDLKIDRNELTVVNCLYRLKNLPDETVTASCPRDAVLKLIRKINPNIFIHGIVNGSYSAPFFLTRFREALFHFSSLFDMFEANAPREDPERLILERGLFGRDAINVIACEGAERVERPETYKQWQIRNRRAGFKQIRVDPELVNHVTLVVRDEYHKDFVVDQDGKWVLLGWKGRIMNALSVWVPA